MATNISATPDYCCIKLQEGADVFGKRNPLLEKRPTGLLDALKSRANTQGVKKIETESSLGKARPTSTSNRSVKVRYTSKDCTVAPLAAVSECSLGTIGDNMVYKESSYTVDQRATWGFDLDEQTYKDFCENPAQVYADYIAKRYDAAKQDLNTKLINAIIPMIGNYAVSGTNSIATPLTIPVVNALGVPNPAALALIESHFMQMNQTESPILVGAGKLDLFNKGLGYSGLAASGLDASRASLVNYFRDVNLNTVLGGGTDHLLAFLPGAFQLLEWYDNVGDYFKKFEMIVNGKSVPSKEMSFVEIDGIRWDMYYEYDCGVHKYRFQKWFDLAQIPSDAFGACQDYNYSLHFLLGCGDLDCGAINSAIGV